MKILIFHNILWSHYKAAVFSELHRIAQDHGDELLVVHLAQNERIRAHMKMPDASIHQYPYRVLDREFIEDWTRFKLYDAMLREVKEYQPDIAVLPGYAFAAYQMLLLRLSFSRKLTLFNTVDSTEYDQPRNWLKESYKSFLLSRVDAAFCYGKLHKSYLMKLGMPEEKIKLRLQATDRTRFKPSPIQPPHKLLFVGRLSPEKNLANAIRSFLNIKSDWEFWIVGDGAEGKALRSQFSDQPTIKFFGNLSVKEIAPIYEQSSALILPSVSETWGLVVNEAMHCGLPVVVSSHCGCSLDLVDEGINGFRFDPCESNDLENALKNLFNFSTTELQKMGDRSSEIIEGFTPEVSAKQMLDAFHDFSANLTETKAGLNQLSNNGQ